MTISPEQITATAKLARLRVEDSEINALTKRITSILDMVDQMQAIDTNQVEPMANSLDAVQQLRSDNAEQPNNALQRRDELLSNAPVSEEGLFLVPKVIE